jgi:hypothetical protein
MPSANPSGVTDYGDVDFFSDPRQELHLEFAATS